LHSSTLSERYKNQCKQMWAFLDVVDANVCMLERTHESRLFCALFMVCPGRAVSCNRHDCSRQSMQRMQNTWRIGTGLCLNARIEMQFSKQLLS